MSEYRERVLIIGSGAAGLTAAIYTARANIDPLLVKGLQPGGQMTITTDVENYPGFADVIQGPWLMEQMEAQARQVGTRMVEDIITSIDTSQRPFHLKGDTGDDYYADAVIVATGAQARWLGLESEARLNGKGVSACATCDGFFFRGQEVAVVGGGNTAVEEALYLSNIASKVTLIHRRDQLRAEKILQDRLFRKENIDIIWNSEVTEICGDDAVESVKIVRKNGVKVIGIMPGDTPLANICDYPLTINVGINNRISKPVTSRIAYTAVIDVLTMGVAQLKPEAQDHLYNIADSQRSLKSSDL